MSKSISIKEGNGGKYFRNVKRLRISGYPSGDTYWVPEDETKLGTRHINKNGTYIASEEKDEQGASKGWYGYEKVTVSGVGKSYTAKEGDRLNGQNLVPNNPYNFDGDPDDPDDPDKTEPVLLPSEIRIIRPQPSHIYHDGEQVVLLPSSVRGYQDDGEGNKVPWVGTNKYPEGIIPNEELKLIPETAHFDGYSGEIYTKNGIVALGIKCDIYSNGDHINGYHCEKPIGEITDGYFSGKYYFLSRNEEGYIYYTRWDGYIYGLSSHVSAHQYIGDKDSDVKGYGQGSAYVSTSDRFQRIFRVEEDYPVFNLIKDNIPISQRNPTDDDFIDPDIDYATQVIEVEWERLLDGAVLETSFNIAVMDLDDSDDDEEEDDEG